MEPETCGAEHPEHPGVLCDVRTDQHKRYHSNRDRGLAWPDPSYPTPVPRTSGGRKKSTKAVLADFLRDQGPGRTIPARDTDPPTSHESTKEIQVRSGSQRALLLIAFCGMVDGTDEEAMQNAYGVSPHSEYSKRCSELRDAGLIAPTGRSRLGSQGIERMVSAITDKGRQVAQGL